MPPIKESYPNGECPDCGEPIPDDTESGDECPNCGHVFYEESDDAEPQDEETP